MSSFASSPSRGKPATPIETVTRMGSSEVSTSKDVPATALRIRSAISAACSGGVSGRRMANSSPPNRAGTSYWRSSETEDLCDPLEDRVAGEMAVRVVDVAQQVEVGHR